MDHPSEEDKRHVLILVKELQEYVRDLPELMKLPKDKRHLIADRMTEIKNELKAFRERYPNA